MYLNHLGVFLVVFGGTKDIRKGHGDACLFVAFPTQMGSFWEVLGGDKYNLLLQPLKG